MGENASRAIMFGVGMFITIIIASSIFSLFSQAKGVFSQVGKTNTDIMKGFGEYPMYNNTQVTGLDVINCANKYYDNRAIIIMYDGTQLNNEPGIQYINSLYESGTLKYEDKFFSALEDVEINGIQRKQVTFTRI